MKKGILTVPLVDTRQSNPRVDATTGTVVLAATDDDGHRAVMGIRADRAWHTRGGQYSFWV